MNLCCETTWRMWFIWLWTASLTIKILKRLNLSLTSLFVWISQAVENSPSEAEFLRDVDQVCCSYTTWFWSPDSAARSAKVIKLPLPYDPCLTESLLKLEPTWGCFTYIGGVIPSLPTMYTSVHSCSPSVHSKELGFSKGLVPCF